ncbi:MAG: RNA pseudouridine synthase, partial [Chlamydiae bacterium]|nr:RNA pseudouridine synthase [Chlamydiota bacterium]
AKNWVKQQFAKPGEVFLHAVHRLDKPVSGLVLFARTSKALSRLNEFMRMGRFKKTYFAVVEGVVSQNTGLLEDYLLHGEHIALKVQKEVNGAKLCRLQYVVIKRGNGKTLLEIDLETGRYHQIRAQLSFFGYPIVGDTKYGAKNNCLGKNKIALHQGKLSFPHPITKEDLFFTCIEPWSFEKINNT